MKNLLITALVVLFTISGFSHRDPDQIYLSTFVYTPKDGMRDIFESAAAKKTQMFNNKEGNYIITYRILNGPDEGSYLRLLIFQQSSNYNSLLQDGEGEYWEKNVAQYVKSSGGMQTWRLIQPLSIGEDGPPPRFLERTVRVSKPGMNDYITKWMYRAGKVVEKMMDNNSLRRSFKLVSGGNPNVYASFRGFDSYPHWGDGTFDETYDELFGWKQASMDRKSLNKAMMEWGYNVISLERVDSMLPKDIIDQISN